MSLIPFILDLADELHEFSRCLASGSDINDFGFGLYTGADVSSPQSQQQQQQQPQQSPRRSRTSSFSSLWMPMKRHHPYNRIKTACCAKTSASGEESVANPSNTDAATSITGTPGKSASYSVVNKNGFQVSMNVKQFAPNELSVKTIDNCIVVEGRHDDKEDGHGVISRHFVRKYMLPKGYDPNDVLSTLSSDGILTVKAPPPPPPATKNDERNERIIEIQPTSGPTQAVVVSAKETATATPQQIKEQTKKVASSPTTRLECQLPEKRQKLDLPNEQVLTETTPSTSVPAPTEPAADTEAETAEADTATESNDVEMEKVDDDNDVEETENNKDQQKPNEGDNDDVDNAENTEKSQEVIENVEKSSEELQTELENLIETEKEILEENILEANGENSMEAETIEESCIVVIAVTDKEEVPAEILTENDVNNEKSSTSKMEVDEIETEGDNDAVAATIITADIENNTDAAEETAAIDETEEETDKTKNCNNTDSNSDSALEATNNAEETEKYEEEKDEEEEKDDEEEKEGNGIITGKLPVDILNSNDATTKANDTTTTTKTTASAESALDDDEDIETAVLTTTATTDTKTIIDDVALLKAAVTADPTDNSAADENDILSESMEGIISEEESSKVDNTVECALLKKSLNGNTATTLVATEEMAN